MTTYVLAPAPAFGFSGVDDYTCHTYAAGTLTPITTWSDAGVTPNSNPFTLAPGAGLEASTTRGWRSVFIIAGTSYRFIYKDTNGTTVLDQDDILIPDGLTETQTVEDISNAVIQWLAFDVVGKDNLITEGSALFEQIVPPCSILEAAGSTKTSSGSGGLTFDIHGNDTTILGNKINIDQSATSSYLAATQPTIATSSFDSPWRMKIDCDEHGDGLATGPAVIMLKVRWA